MPDHPLLCRFAESLPRLRSIIRRLAGQPVTINLDLSLQKSPRVYRRFCRAHYLPTPTLQKVLEDCFAASTRCSKSRSINDEGGLVKIDVYATCEQTL